MKEHRTAKVVEGHLRSFGLRPRRLAGTGVVADVAGGGPGRTILLRADTDALPVQEVAGRPHGSVHPGVMHACGHDGHAACLLGAAERLAARPPEKGRVRLCFQPGRRGGRRAGHGEGGGAPGAGPRRGRGPPPLDQPPRGQGGVLDGPCMAAVDWFEIRVRGTAATPPIPRTPGTRW